MTTLVKIENLGPDNIKVNVLQPTEYVDYESVQEYYLTPGMETTVYVHAYQCFVVEEADVKQK